MDPQQDNLPSMGDGTFDAPKKRFNRVSKVALKQYHEAIECGDAKRIQRQLDSGLSIKENLKLNTYHGRSLQAHACEEGNAVIARMLLEAGVDRDLGFPLHAACREYNVKMVRQLLEFKCRTDDQDLAGEVCLVISARHNEHAIVSALLDAGADRELSGADGKSALMAAAEQGNKGIVEKLLAAGACLDAQNSHRQDWTALHYAAMEGMDRVVSQLLSASANMYTARVDTPLSLACLSGETKTVRLLLKAVDFVKEGPRALACASETGDIALVTMLVKEDMLALCNAKDPCPLAAAVLCQRRGVQEYLLSCRRWPYAPARFLYACELGVRKVIFPFLPHLPSGLLGSFLNQSNQTCLHLVAQAEDIVLIEKLLAWQLNYLEIGNNMIEKQEIENDLLIK